MYIQDLLTNLPFTTVREIDLNNQEKFFRSNLTNTEFKQILTLTLSNIYCQFN